MHKVLLSFLLCWFLCGAVYAQQKPINPQDTVPVSLFEKRFNEKYQKNIKKSRINGVYIPKNLAEAHEELKALSPAESLEKFKNAEKEFVVGRLHYGLGRWMILNWNFYDGSRYAHYLSELGLSHPDDMARFTLLTFHDVLNGKEPDVSKTINKLLKERQQIIQERLRN